MEQVMPQWVEINLPWAEFRQQALCQPGVMIRLCGIPDTLIGDVNVSGDDSSELSAISDDHIIIGALDLRPVIALASVRPAESQLEADKRRLEASVLVRMETP